MIKYKTCAGNIGALIHTCDPCDTPELGRVRSLVLIKKGTSISIPFQLKEWQNAIESGQIIIIPKTVGSFDGGTPKVGDGYGDEQERKLGDDYVLSVKDPGYAKNKDFWQTAEGETWNVAFRTETMLQYVKADCKLTAKAPIEEGLDTRVVWNIEVKWFSAVKPEVSEFEPIAEVFNCHEVVADDGNGE